ncbi:alpha/beta hydrolase [Streptomyces sp. NPDC060194]|uniref:alpha/beta hydrolase n=1 Tax=Streptomyces sp. NPDC060194 TaxID=3347069 RepID=UPI003646AC7D
MSRVTRAGALLAASLLLTATACDSEPSEDSGPRAGSSGATEKSSATPGTPQGDALPEALTGQRVKWSSCEPQGWTCADVTVPVDYRKPDGETMNIALIRKESAAKKPIGSLLFNFGGPGGSGVEILPRAASQYGKLAERYDLVSFDPRGVAKSDGVRCRSDAEMEKAASVDLTPDTPAEEKAYFADATAFGKGCEKGAGTLLPHLTTTNTARDMDLIRHLLGDEKMHYFGMSYGTELGGTYAHLFPQNVGRITLDAVVDPTADTFDHALNQTLGFQRALDNYLKANGKDPKKGTQEIVDLLERIDEKPLRTTDGRRLNDSLALTGIVLPLYSQSSWPSLTAALRQAEAGDGSGLIQLADAYNERDSSGKYSTQSHSQRAISCADDKQRPTPEEAEARLGEFRKTSPVFGEFLGWDVAGWCADWPVEGEHQDADVSAEGSAPILVVGTTGDPATPYEGARKMADELGKGVGVLLTNKGEGHGAYGSATCATAAIDAYFLDGKTPEDGTTCES